MPRGNAALSRVGNIRPTQVLQLAEKRQGFQTGVSPKPSYVDGTAEPKRGALLTGTAWLPVKQGQAPGLRLRLGKCSHLGVKLPVTLGHDRRRPVPTHSFSYLSLPTPATDITIGGHFAEVRPLGRAGL